jgi:hypothetical protein
MQLYEVCEQYVKDGWRDLELDLRSDLAHCQRKCGHFQKYVKRDKTSCGRDLSILDYGVPRAMYSQMI